MLLFIRRIFASPELRPFIWEFFKLHALFKENVIKWNQLKTLTLFLPALTSYINVVLTGKSVGEIPKCYHSSEISLKVSETWEFIQFRIGQVKALPQASFTAVKRKKLRHFQSVGALKFESVQKFTSAKFVWRRCTFRQTEFHAGKTCAWPLLHFQHILNVKSLSFQKRR